jgi:pyruvate,water dikinase
MGPVWSTLRSWGRGIVAPEAGLRARYAAFRTLLDADAAALRHICALEESLGPAPRCDRTRTAWLCARLGEAAHAMARCLAELSPQDARGLEAVLDGILARLDVRLDATPPPSPPVAGPLVLPLDAALGAPRLCGGKAANLAFARSIGLAVPPGFVISAAACELVLAQGGLRGRLDRLLRLADLDRPERLPRLCAAMQELVLAAPLPDELAHAMDAALSAPEMVSSGMGGKRLAVRSSAVAEDGEASFAGQYASLLDVEPGGLRRAYLRILAAKYRPRAVTYRILCGLSDAETPMAVLVMPMVAARLAGVLHTAEARRGAGGRAGRCVRVDATPGLGDALMAGRDSPRTLRLARRLPPELLDGDLPGGERPEPPLGKAALAELLLAGLVLEARLGRPQEVEWALDAEGRVFVLQSRPHSAEPLASDSVGAPDTPDTPDTENAVVLPDVEGSPVLALGLDCVSGGAAAGVVRHASLPADMAEVPEGAVLAVESLSPSLARCLGRACAVVASCGSRASHFGSIAREFGLPVVSGLPDVLARLPEGRLVTVDANAGRVLDGRAEAVLAAARRLEGLARLRSPGAACRELLGLCCRLTLTDPEAPEFAPAGCASLHDAVRYCHEKATQAMFSLPDGPGLGRARRLRTRLPLALYLLDLGGGLTAGEGLLGPEDVLSAPFCAVWRGLAHGGEVWPEGDFCCDWQEFDRLSAGIFRKDSRRLASYALVGADYLHLLVRFGYHFAVLDALCGERPEANFLGLRFKGGGGLPEQRLLRVRFTARVLEALGFTVDARGDLLQARLARPSAAAGLDRLTVLGRLLVRTLRLDVRLRSTTQAEGMALDFLADCGHAGRMEKA